jgi:hypothetical protein
MLFDSHTEVLEGFTRHMRIVALKRAYNVLGPRAKAAIVKARLV